MFTRDLEMCLLAAQREAKDRHHEIDLKHKEKGPQPLNCKSHVKSPKRFLAARVVAAKATKAPNGGMSSGRPQAQP